MPRRRLPLPSLAPPAVEQPVHVPHQPPPPRFRELGLSDTLTVDEWEWSWLCALQPAAVKRLPYIHGNGQKAGEEGVFPRIGETIPVGNARGRKQPRHTLTRYLHCIRERCTFLAGVGPEPEPRGPPVELRDRNPCNLLPSNRHPMSPEQEEQDAQKHGRPPRRGHDAAWSVKVRMAAVLAGRDPDKEMQRRVRKSVRQAEARERRKAERAAAARAGKLAQKETER